MPLPAADLHPQPVPPAPLLPKGLSISPAGTRVEGVTQRKEAKPMDGNRQTDGGQAAEPEGNKRQSWRRVMAVFSGAGFLGWHTQILRESED